MYNNNSYFGGNQFTGSYMPYNSYNQYQRPAMAQPQQQTQYGDVPFLFTGYGTLDEAKAFIVPPTKAVMFIDKSKSQFYIKSCDSAGNPSLETFNYTGESNSSTESVSPVFDPKEFVKTSDLVDIVRKDDLKGLVSVADVKNFITKDDLQGINAELDKIQKQIKMSELWKGDSKNAKC